MIDVISLLLSYIFFWPVVCWFIVSLEILSSLVYLMDSFMAAVTYWRVVPHEEAGILSLLHII